MKRYVYTLDYFPKEHLTLDMVRDRAAFLKGQAGREGFAVGPLKQRQFPFEVDGEVVTQVLWFRLER